MKRSLYSIFLLCSVAFAAQQRFVIDEIGNPGKAEENAFALNENFEDLAREKVDKSSQTLPNQVRFRIHDLANPELAEQNAYAINENFRDLWQNKVDVSTPGLDSAYFVDDLLNTKALDDEVQDRNTFAINEEFSRLWQEKADRE